MKYSVPKVMKSFMADPREEDDELRLISYELLLPQVK